MELFLLLLAMIILLLLEGFFSGSEIALVHADKIRLHARANQGHRGSMLVVEMFRRPDILLTTTLVGTNISVVTAAIVVASALRERGFESAAWLGSLALSVFVLMLT